MAPLFSAVSGSARQLFILLRCIAFAPKAQVEISAEGLRFAVDDARTMQGMVFLAQNLFTSYRFQAPSTAIHNGNTTLDPDDDEEQDDKEDSTPSFEISLSALLETLQILTPPDSGPRQSARESSYAGAATSAFDTRVLGIQSLCKLTYSEPGAPLRIELEEGNVVTTCSLISYEPDPPHEDIPFDKQRITMKMIIRATALHDAVNELAATGPDRVVLTASPEAPFLTLSAEGSLGSTTVEFSGDPQVLETCQVSHRTVNSYKFSMIKAAGRAMAVASKISLRGDEQGVLSLQFMIEVEGGETTFVDFRFVPYLSEDDESTESEDENDGAS